MLPLRSPTHEPEREAKTGAAKARTVPRNRKKGRGVLTYHPQRRLAWGKFVLYLL